MQLILPSTLFCAAMIDGIAHESISGSDCRRLDPNVASAFSFELGAEVLQAFCSPTAGTVHHSSPGIAMELCGTFLMSKPMVR